MHRARLAVPASVLLFLAFASCTGAVDDIAEVKALDDLQKAKPIKVGDDWEVRLGLGDAGAAAEGWKLIYCLAKYIGPEKGETVPSRPMGGGWRSGVLGPVGFEVVDKSAKESLRLLDMIKVEVSVPREGLYFGVVPLVRKGDFAVRVFIEDGELREDRRRVIAEKEVAVRDAPRLCWVRFATRRDDPKEGEPRSAVCTESVPFLPKADGMYPVWDLSKMRDSVKGEMPLPGTVPALSGWTRAVEWKHVENAGGEEDRPLLRIALEKGVVTVRCGVSISLALNEHLLARWWVNGKLKPVAEERFETLEKMDRTGFGREGQAALALPPFLGKLKVGDKVGLQVLYSPREIERAPWPDDVERLEDIRALKNQDPADAIDVPLLSNRIEFDVTAEMLAGRGEPPAK